MIEITGEILRGKYPQAEFAYLSGSYIRGEATDYSDLDIVVIFRELPSAYRESFYFRSFPVETFVHTPETLNYFFAEDARRGVPSLPAMVAEGIAVPQATDLSEKLKALAEKILGDPPQLTAEEIETLRYRITDVIDDLRQPRSKAELTASGTGLYPVLAEFFLRTGGHWSASRKTIPRHLEKADPEFRQKFCDAFEELFAAGKTEKVIDLTEELLRPFGGFLFDGVRSDAPPDWRKTFE
ncbi:MAG: nucleotidyltransferase domain-containing protein [Pyrinomonadaceae bacterium]